MSSCGNSLVVVVCALITLVGFLPLTDAQIPAWTWLDGGRSDVLDELYRPEYPWPGSRSGSATWKDKTGNIWLFGGFGYGEENIGVPTLLNDIWKYDNSQKRWFLVNPKKGAAVPSGRHLAAACGVTGNMFVVSGGLGVDDFAFQDTWIFYIDKSIWIPLELNGSFPLSRGDAATWCGYDKMYVFGGMHHSTVIRSDMWSFSLHDLTWTKVLDSPVITGTDHKSTNFPRGRNGAMTWLGRDSDELYMFGGNVLSNNFRNRSQNFGYTSDMWMYSISSNKWVLLFGSVEPGKPGKYSSRHGQIGINGAIYSPGCRRAGATWTDEEGNLWLFGGDGTDETIPNNYRSSLLLSDLWRFYTTPSSKDHPWTWVGGSRTGEEELNGGNRLTAGYENTPGARCESSAWTLGQQLYLFGGRTHTSIGTTHYMNGLWVLTFAHFRMEVAAWVLLLIVFFGLALVGILVGVAIYVRKQRHFQGHSNTRYAPLSDSPAFES